MEELANLENRKDSSGLGGDGRDKLPLLKTDLVNKLHMEPIT